MNVEEIEKYIIEKEIKDMSLEEIKDFIEKQTEVNLINHKIIDKRELEIERLNNIINELEKDLKEAYDCLVPNELINGRELIDNISNDLKELKENK